MKYGNDWRCFFSPYSRPVICFQFANFSLNLVQGRNVVQRFFGDLALVGRVQVEELALCMGHAADLGNTQFKTCLVASEVVARQFAAPTTKEVSGMFASAARAEVVTTAARSENWLVA